MYCKNCKYWNNNYKGIKEGFSDCERPDFSTDDKIYIEISADDDSGLNIALFTHETFSCSEFRERSIK